MCVGGGCGGVCADVQRSVTLSGDTTQRRMIGVTLHKGDTNPCRMTGVTLHYEATNPCRMTGVDAYRGTSIIRNCAPP